MKITIRIHPVRNLEFPYGHLSEENRNWIKEHQGEIFEAIQWSMNYYLMPENGMKIHVYDATELDEIPRKPSILEKLKKGENDD
jgi:hypothetical protein